MKSMPWAVFAAALSLITVAPTALILRAVVIVGDRIGPAELIPAAIIFGPVTVGLGFGARSAWRRALGRAPAPTRPGPTRKVLWILLALFLGFNALGGLIAVSKATDGPSLIGSLVFSGLFTWGAIASWRKSGGPAHPLTGHTERGQWQPWGRKQ
ncbi:hypothetical protein PV392_13635 [Streptomyces sp. ME03-5709C]|nr:hypothetical protein [Streptomyces sp. ME03-5709C]